MKLEYVKEQAKNLRKENKTYIYKLVTYYIFIYFRQEICGRMNLGRILKWVANQKSKEDGYANKKSNCLHSSGWRKS